MRFYRGSVCRVVLFATFLTILLVIPVISSAARIDTVKNERRAIQIDAQFGEPGHDPFLREWEPGGDTWQNREGNRETYIIPGSGGGGNGGSQQTSPQSFIRITGDLLIRIIDTLL
ncbi:MAG TPA: hypothetical protein VLA34_02490 [Candidatus Krumholzibacterium sp.]|nr:hypothetical protein [Candidatus Krumholzibacterium sp.]